jgi:hypothetical protein
MGAVRREVNRDRVEGRANRHLDQSRLRSHHEARLLVSQAKSRPGDAVERPPRHRAEAADVGGRLRQDCRAIREIVVVTVDDQRLAQECSERKLVAILPNVVSQKQGKLVVDEMYGPRARKHVVCRLGIEPGMGSAHAESLESRSKQRYCRCVRAGAVRWRHDPRNRNPVPSFKAIHASQRFGESLSPLAVTLRAVELAEYMIVPMDEK